VHISENTVQVRYAETDQMGVVYHANYLIWMELGRTKLIEDLGFNYAEIEKDGILSPVVDLNINYKTPVRYGEKALVKTWVEDYDGIRITYAYEIYNEENKLAVSGQSKHVCVKKESFRPISIRRMFPDWHEAYEKAKKQTV
jgi:acyl-CoA thioester hydrolase